MFHWDNFLLGARAGAYPANINVPGLTADNDLSNADGMWFNNAPHVCWVQTDGRDYTDVTNCMLLVALPGKVPAEHTLAANLAAPNSTWHSATPGPRPRSATIVIVRNDGEVTGA